MKTLKIKIRKLSNSYGSEPSSGSGSSMGEHHDYTISDEENMHLPYLLKPPSYQNEVTIETTNPYSPKLVGSKQERDLSFSEDSSPDSPFIGFGDSPFGKLKKMLYNYNSPIKKATPIKTVQENQQEPQLVSPVGVIGPSPGKLLFANFFDIIIEENSCNAVDVVLSNELADSQVLCSGSNNSNAPSSELSFNGKIKSMCKADQGTLENAVSLQQPLTIAAQRLPTLLETTLNSSYTTESSFVLKKYTNEKSPDLFGDDDENDDDGNAGEYTHLTDETQPPMYTFEDVIEEVPEAQLQHELSTNKSFNCPTESSFADEQTMEANEHTQQSDSQSLFRANCRREKELLRRIRTCLSGVPPPPTMTIPQMDLITTVLKRKDEILNFHKTELLHPSINSCSNSSAGSLLKPTHSLEETQSMAWRDILSVRQHGLSFNLSKASESNEYLSLSVIDRFVGAETASSYQLSPSSAKKRNLRLKMLTASPGNRLSHLAKRRAIFSSANLATTSQKSTSSLGTQILLDKKKPKNRRKGTTPKRKTPASKKKNVRKTPSSSARKRLYRCDLIKPGPSRESSKRALFQSPAKALQPQRYCLPKPTIKPEIATRVEKSKRALFSPDKLSQCLSHSSYNAHFGGESSNSSHAYQSATAYSTASSSTQQLESLLQKRKRHRADDDDEDDAAILAEAQNSKIFRGSMHSLTPRALQIKSQSFCIGAGSSAQRRSHSGLSGDDSAAGQILQHGLSSSQMLLHSRNNSSLLAAPSAKLMRAQSENATMTTNNLTENQRKKLLWAVSQALQEKKITAKHESFKEYASVLARVVRRIFQEYYQKGSASNSETMLRLAKKYAYNVIAGKNVDDIYFHAKTQIDENKRKACSRLCGYIAPEEYENRKISKQNIPQQNFNGSMHNIFGMENSMDCLSMSISQTSSVAVSTTLSSIAASQTSMLEQVSQTEITHNSANPTDTQDPTNYSLKQQQQQQQQCIKLPIQTNSTLQKSSSKNNLCGLALRENVDCEQRRSAQKNFTGKDQRNVSPYAAVTAPNRLGSAVKLQSNVMHDLFAATAAAKAKRHISFDS